VTYELDAELAPAITALAAQAALAPRPAPGDWNAAREAVSAGLAYMATLTPASSGVTIASFATHSSDGGGQIELRWYTKVGAEPGSAIVYAHGGGVIGGSLDLYESVTPGMSRRRAYRSCPSDIASLLRRPTAPRWPRTCSADLPGWPGMPSASGSTPPASPSWATAAVAARPPERPFSPATETSQANPYLPHAR
jgi:hypothetical protein